MRFRACSEQGCAQAASATPTEHPRAAEADVEVLKAPVEADAIRHVEPSIEPELSRATRKRGVSISVARTHSNPTT